MKRLFDYVTKKQDENIFVKSEEKEEFVAPNISWFHTWSLNETRDALSDSLFNNIPNEIILHIFRFFSIPDLCNVSFVCRSFKIIADQDQLWKSKCDCKSIYYLYQLKELFERGRDLFRTGCIVCSPPSYPLQPTNKQKVTSIQGFYQHPNSSQEM
jgi:hypothetical protein